MQSTFNIVFQTLPLPILIGIFIWIFSLCLFSLFIILIYILLNPSSSKISELGFSHEDKHLKSVFSCDSLSLVSIEKTHKDIDDQLNSFYLKHVNHFKKEPRPSLPLVKLRSLITNDTKSIPNRSIIKDLNSFSNSYKEKKLHLSIDSLFSKDSLVQ